MCDWSVYYLLCSSSLVRLVDSEDVSLEQVQAMDEQILKWYRKSRNEAFLPFY